MVKVAKSKKEKFKNYNLINHLCNDESIKPEVNDSAICYNFNEKINFEKLNKILNKCSYSSKDIINLFINNELLITRILNYNDIHNGLFKYNLKYNKLDKDIIKKIDNIINDNIQEYITNYENKRKN